MEVQVKKLIRYTYPMCLFSIFFMKRKQKKCILFGNYEIT